MRMVEVLKVKEKMLDNFEKRFKHVGYFDRLK
jgi:hypothetical protein